MLLQRLVEYANSSDDVVPPFYERKPVRWTLDLDRHGRPRSNGLSDTADKSDPQRRHGASRVVPAITRASGIAPNLAVDNGEYLFGWLSEDAKSDLVAERHQSFRDLIAQWANAEPDGLGSAIAAFYRDGHDRKFRPPVDWGRGDLISITVDGQHAAETLAGQRFWAVIANTRKGSGRTGICLVCGDVQPLLKTIPQLIPSRWVPGAKNKASLVSVNEAVHGYELRKFLENTPICVDCGLKFMTALTDLLSNPDHSVDISGQNVRLAWWVVGGSTFDAWAELEQPDPLKIRQMLAGPSRGVQSHVDDLSTYCSVAVSGNVARVVVRDWVEQPVREVQQRIQNWFDDIEIIDDYNAEVAAPKLSHLVRVTGRFESGRGGGGSWVRLGAKGEDRPPDAFQGLLGSALMGRPLPPRLLNHVVKRIRADGRLDTARAGLVRLALRRHPHHPNREGLTPTLNAERKQPAYVCGRIFAVMDDLQRTVFRVANQNINTTFAERYFARAIDNPQVVLVSGRRNVTAWLKRLRGPLRRAPWATAYERRLDELFFQLDTIPGSAVLTDKAEFILGYHQQRADLRAERVAAAERKKQTDLPPALEDVPADSRDEGVKA